MAEGCGGRVGGRTVAKIPEAVGNSAGGSVGARDGQRLQAVGRRAGKQSDRNQGSDAKQRVSTVAGVARGKANRVAKIARAGRSELNYHVGGTEPGENERRAGKDGERSAGNGSNAIA